MKRLFGTDGIRGEAGIFPLDKKTISIIGNSLADQMRSKLGRSPRFIIGRDTRESGGWIEKAFCDGAAASGAECRSAKIITTPGIAFLTKALDLDAGIVVSASHNPFSDNGIKLFSPTGRKLDSETEKQIEQAVFENTYSENSASNSVVSNGDAAKYQEMYIDHLIREFPNISLKNYRIVLDCANGAASEIAPQLFEKLGAETIVINSTPDGRNINKNCGSLYIDNLRNKVLETKADLGVAFDGDADRSLFVDENGKFVDGDAVLWIMSQHLQTTGELKNDTIVATVMSNLGLEVALNARNIKLLRAPVGDKYVLQELLKSGAALGGEQSGHIIFPFKSLVGDGIFTTLYLLSALTSYGKSLSQMNSGFEQFPQILVNIKVKHKPPFEDVPEILKASQLVESELGEKGRLLLRYSGTENLARVMIEGEDQNAIEEQANRLASVIENCLA